MSSSSAPPKAVVDFVAAHSDAEVLDSGKVRCSTTGHECLPQLDVLRAHWEGKTYRKKAALVAYDFEQHAPHLVPHKQSKHLLYCTVTRQPVSRQPSAVEGHVNGKRFKRMLAEREAAQAKRSRKRANKGKPSKQAPGKDAPGKDALPFPRGAGKVATGSSRPGGGVHGQAGAGAARKAARRQAYLTNMSGRGGGGRRAGRGAHERGKR
ncbi:hypothetical protein EMIHUDRAFT_229737 [Emiliania huxleyi CCMP1516]|uniref:Uncharacterized protein n=2 Tax=Emiliania huxleyi TaxID=2903 RepID=A0A0D3KCB8_EMIH1|nr:hypothetical protein EMIHUDRAFT_229737 [Emiliania huxleyi CCMP1516]EOD33403.1 hypothetical protein EMIHUDRAFT_229737 [Emiliania huxleyi CCMP1516]|eukprot:XP_005785832.1 hypothetical protein EMIHUDRAFT_229737 [Emiliania huxleyi CCMP1516]